MAILDSLTPEYRTFDDILHGLGEVERVFYEGRDRRAIFATAYISITAELKRRVEGGAFLDNGWVARYAVSFANLYRKALLAFEREDAWDLSGGDGAGAESAGAK